MQKKKKIILKPNSTQKNFAGHYIIKFMEDSLGINYWKFYCKRDRIHEDYIYIYIRNIRLFH